MNAMQYHEFIRCDEQIRAAIRTFPDGLGPTIEAANIRFYRFIKCELDRIEKSLNVADRQVIMPMLNERFAP